MSNFENSRVVNSQHHDVISLFFFCKEINKTVVLIGKNLLYSITNHHLSESLFLLSFATVNSISYIKWRLIWDLVCAVILNMNFIFNHFITDGTYFNPLFMCSRLWMEAPEFARVLLLWVKVVSLTFSKFNWYTEGLLKATSVCIVCQKKENKSQEGKKIMILIKTTFISIFFIK